MLKKLLLLSVLPGIVWAAEGQGVQELNYEATGVMQMADDTDMLGARAKINAPVIDYIGASAELEFYKFNATSDDYVDSTQRNLTLSGFLRDEKYGKFRLAYVSAIMEYDGGSESFVMTDIGGDVYLNRFTVGVDQFHVKDFFASSDDYYSVAVQYYINDDIKVKAGMSADEFKLNDEDTHFVALNLQPVSNVEVGLSYMRSPGDKKIDFSVSYFFDTKVSLIKRDRQYR